MTELDAAELRELLQRHHLQLAAVGTGAGWLQRRWSLTSRDPAIRRNARAFIAGIIDFAAQFNAPAIVGSMQGRVEAGGRRPQAERWLATALRALGTRAGRRGTFLLYEPLNRYETDLFNRVEDAAKFLQRGKIRHVKLLCDLFHMNLEEASIPAALRRVARLVGHIHFADSNRQAVGFGHLEMAPIASALRDIGYTGYLSAEILPRPNPLRAARQTLRAIRQFTAPN